MFDFVWYESRLPQAKQGNKRKISIIADDADDDDVKFNLECYNKVKSEASKYTLPEDIPYKMNGVSSFKQSYNALLHLREIQYNQGVNN
jgi:hypothetical protein